MKHSLAAILHAYHTHTHILSSTYPDPMRQTPYPRPNDQI